MAETKKITKISQVTEKLSRREFLMVGTAVVSSLALSKITRASDGKVNAREMVESKHKWGMVIDINLCIGCNYCTYSCQAINNLSDDMKYNILTTETTENGDEYFLSRPCMHCANPPCVQVCPVAATYQRADGIIGMDYDLCIGCRYCMVACPYDVRVFNWYEHTEDSPRVPDFGTPEIPPRDRGVMEKCTFCSHRVDYGLERDLIPGIDAAATPACVVACPTGARVFGDMNDNESPVNKKLAVSDNPIRLREELSTEPSVLYIPPRAEEG